MLDSFVLPSSLLDVELVVSHGLSYGVVADVLGKALMVTVKAYI